MSAATGLDETENELGQGLARFEVGVAEKRKMCVSKCEKSMRPVVTKASKEFSRHGTLAETGWLCYKAAAFKALGSQEVGPFVVFSAHRCLQRVWWRFFALVALEVVAVVAFRATGSLFVAARCSDLQHHLVTRLQQVPAKAAQKRNRKEM